MSLIILGSVAFDALETPFGKTDKIVGGAASYAALAASYLYDDVKIISVVGEDFGQGNLEYFRDPDQSGRKVILLVGKVP